MAPAYLVQGTNRGDLPGACASLQHWKGRRKLVEGSRVVVGQSLGHACSAKTHVTASSTGSTRVEAGPCQPWVSSSSAALGPN